ncbi:MAG: sigma-70 family RNA polymerase sigma factor [Planctomycetota bacterium]
MSSPETCWTALRSAAAGGESERASFSELYLPVVRASLTARWRGGPLEGEVDDAVQEVLVECLRDGGILERAVERADRGFRAWLYGATRNVARRFEERRWRREDAPGADTFRGDEREAADTSLSGVFDREWARGLVRAARELLVQKADAASEAARRRVELLRLRFFDDLPIREIAKRWDEDPARVHHEYAAARKEFLGALREVVAFHNPDSTPSDVDRELQLVLGGL